MEKVGELQTTVSELKQLVERVKSGEIVGVQLPTLEELLTKEKAELHKTILRDLVLSENFNRGLSSELQRRRSSRLGYNLSRNVRDTAREVEGTIQLP